MEAILKQSECPNDQHVFLPWYLYDDQESFLIRFEGLQQRFPKRRLFPFARRDDNDDILHVGKKINLGK